MVLREMEAIWQGAEGAFGAPEPILARSVWMQWASENHPKPRAQKAQQESGRWVRENRIDRSKQRARQSR